MTPSHATPPAGSLADCQVTKPLVAKLLKSQCPAFAGTIRYFSTGWDNVLYLVGERWLVRLPRHKVGSDNIERESAWLAQASSGIELAAPVPLYVGTKAFGFPHRWSVVPFAAGLPAGEGRFEPKQMALDLGRFLQQLHQPSPKGAPTEASRSSGLGSKRKQMLAMLADGALFDKADGERLTALWNRLEATPPYAGPPRWVHGDLHPYNMVVKDERLVSVIDWGDLFGGDPSVDYASAWMLLDHDHHHGLRTQAGPKMWLRGAGWALYFAIVLRRAVADGAGVGLGRVSSSVLARLQAALGS